MAERLKEECLFPLFCEYHKTKGSSPNTLILYSSHRKALFREIGFPDYLCDVNTNSLKAYLRETSSSATTKAIYVTFLRTYVFWALRNGYVFKTFAEEIKELCDYKTICGRAAKQRASADEVSAFIDYVESFTDIRTQVITYLHLCGLRAKDIVSLSQDCLTRSDIFYLTFGGKALPLPGMVGEALCQYLMTKSKGSMLITGENGPLTAGGLYKVLAAASESCGIEVSAKDLTARDVVNWFYARSSYGGMGSGSIPTKKNKGFPLTTKLSADELDNYIRSTL